ncbi:MAG: peptide chain release factor N(5)-glutamine methyltransferase [bacterium]
MIERLPLFIAAKAEPLIAAGIDQGRAEVEIILCHLLSCDRLHLYLDGPGLISPAIEGRLDDIIADRAKRQPLQYILGEAWFYGRRFVVTPDVMVPTPETELLCETATRYVASANLSQPRLLDIGVGSGVISVTLANELPNCAIVAVDISEPALGVARENAEALGGAERIEFRQSDLLAAVRDEERFDLVLSNPPYISESEYIDLPPEVLADPKIALTAGEKGMDVINAIVSAAPAHLADGGRLMFEIGYNQADLVTELTGQDSRYTSLLILKDLNDIDRVVVLGCD